MVAGASSQSHRFNSDRASFVSDNLLIVAALLLLAKSVLPGSESRSWICLLAHTKLPEDILVKLNVEIMKALKVLEITKNVKRR